jgi:integrase
MRALIGPDLLRRLPVENKDVRDTKLTGFVLRCRASGAHSYLVTLGRGRSKTIGRVGEMAPEAARLAANAILQSVSRNTLSLMADDLSLTMREARTKAHGTVRRSKASRQTLKTFIEETYAPWARAHRKTGDETVARLLARFADFADVRLADLTGFAIERWRSSRHKAGAAPATTNRDLAALRGALSKAVEWQVIKAHPLRDVKAARVDAIGHVRFLSADEEAHLFAALDARDECRRRERDTANAWRPERGYDELPAFGVYTDHLHPLVLLALQTGCRRGELFDLQWRDVDLVAARLTVRAEAAKSGRARVVPMNADAVSAVRAWQPAGVESTDYVFPADDGRRLQDVKTAFLKIAREIGLKDFRFHDLRHSFASNLVAAGVDLNTVRELLGHTDLKMTIRYAHLAPAHKAAAVAKLVRTARA